MKANFVRTVFTKHHDEELGSPCPSLLALRQQAQQVATASAEQTPCTSLLCHPRALQCAIFCCSKSFPKTPCRKRRILSTPSLSSKKRKCTTKTGAAVELAILGAVHVPTGANTSHSNWIYPFVKSSSRRLNRRTRLHQQQHQHHHHAERPGS